MHQDGKYAIFFLVCRLCRRFETRRRESKPQTTGFPEPAPAIQQPRQIFFSRAFISASSALMESTRAAAASAFGGGAVRNAGFAAAADAAVAAILS
jgi:hypothetical protein